MTEVSRIKAIRLMTEYLDCIKFPQSPENDRTPERIVDMHLTEFSTLYDPDPPFKTTLFENGCYDQLIVEKDIDFASWCSHHLVPFRGRAHVGYLPDKHIVGLSKMPRIVEHFSHQPTTQEDLGQQIADFLMKTLKPKALYIALEAEHMCVSCRGARSRNAVTLTCVVRGPLGLKAELKSEFFSLIGR